MKALLGLMVGLLVWLMWASAAVGVQALSTAELKAHCDVYNTTPGGEDGIFCVRYVQGFIDGAVATDTRVTQNVADEFERDETFTQRAIRTRLGNRLDRYGPSYYAEFCLGEPVPLAGVVKLIVKGLDDAALVAAHPQARELVYDVLRSQFPCDADTDS